jgi:hypothetical protein
VLLRARQIAGMRSKSCGEKEDWKPDEFVLIVFVPRPQFTATGPPLL